MPKPNPDPNPQRRGHTVRVISCYASMCSGPGNSVPMAVLTFSRGREVLEPYLLSLIQVHVLVRDLIRVLKSVGNPQDGEGGTGTDEGLTLPPIPVAPSNKGRSRKPPLPSRRSSSPTGPIQTTEVWRLHSMLKNVKNHDDFLKLIGADDIAVESSIDADTAAPPAESPLLVRRKKAAKPPKKPTSNVHPKKRRQK